MQGGPPPGQRKPSKSTPPTTRMVPTQSNSTPPEWESNGLVVLAGAGTSVGSPANVPSWWDFNQAVLDGVRDGLHRSVEAPVHSRKALAALSLEALDITEFSQIIHNAFAGNTWFELLGVLDGETPNTTHRTLAGLAQSGILQAVVTTNFDTLLERSLPSKFAAMNPLIDDVVPHSGSGALVKLHGSAAQPRSLVDLAAQKRRGLTPAWRDWLETLFSSHSVLVLGFSGSDLEFADDYLGLLAAASSTPWLAWNVREGQIPHPKASEIVAASGKRGRFLVGDLPDALREFGIGLIRVPTRQDSEERLPKAVCQWLSQDGIDSAVCGVALTRLLDAAGSHSAADALRSRLRTQTRRALRDGLNLSAATRASLVLGQIGIDDRDIDRSLKDLDLSERALTAVADHLRQTPEGFSPEGEVEFAKNVTAILHCRAVWLLRQGEVDAAEQEMERAWKFVETLPDTQRNDRMAAHWQNLWRNCLAPWG